MKKNRELAKELFVRTGMTQREIASKVGVTENTISTWVKKYGWKELKFAKSISKDQLVRSSYESISAIFDLSKKENRPLTAAETDQLYKLGKLVKDIEGEATISVIVQVITEQIEYVHRNIKTNEQLEALKLLVTITDNYIKEVVKKGTLLGLD